MSVTDEVLHADEAYARDFKLGNLPMPPARKLAILACMDARITVEQVCGLRTGDAHIIRNAGGIATDDALRSFIISHHLLGTQEFIVINHTDCGMLTFKDDELKAQIEADTGIRPAFALEAFADAEKDVVQSLARIAASVFIPHKDHVRGFVYDVRSGRLREVNALVAA